MAIISDVRIANMALSNVGAKSNIEAIGENSPEGTQTELWYDYSRLQTLAAFDWSFARKRQTLALHGDAAPAAVWTYRYQYPSDCVVMRLMENPLGKQADAVPFEIEISDDGTKSILTDLEDAVGIYTFDLTTTSLFSPHFVEALSHMLGAHISYAITGKREVKGDMISIFNALIVEAPAHNANEEQRPPPRDAEWIRARA